MSDHTIARVIITGTHGALGGVVAQIFAQKGIEVIGLDVGYDHDTLTADDDVDGLWTMNADLTDAEAVAHALDAARARGEVDGLVHCAGGFRWSRLDDYKDKDIEFLVQVNLVSSIYMVRGVLGAMRERGFGRIVLISSKSTLNPGVGESVYAATKGALNAIVKSVAREVASDDITINAVLPSVIDTPANREEMSDADFETWVKREQLADIIYQLVATETGAPINGALIPVTNKT